MLRRAARVLTALPAFAAGLLAVVMLAPALAGYERYIITGSSMNPTLPKGSLLYSRAVPVTDLRTGDIITYLPPVGAQPVRHSVTHRIAATGAEPRGGRRTFRTRGDNNAAADPWLFTLPAATQARYSWHLPYVGYAFVALSHRPVRMLLVGVPALLIALALTASLWRDSAPSAEKP